MSKQFIETTFCGFTAKEVMEMKSRIDETEAQLAIPVEALEKIKQYLNVDPEKQINPDCIYIPATEALTRIKQLQEGEKA